MYFGCVVGILVIWKTIKDPSTKIFLIIAIVILAVICGIYYGWKALKEKQQNANIREDITQHSSATPRGLSDPGQRARLEDLRRNSNRASRPTSPAARSLQTSVVRHCR